MTVVLSTAPNGRELFALVDVDGVERAFVSHVTSYGILPGVTGRLMAPVDLVEDAVPFRQGARLRRATLKSHPFSLPTIVLAATQQGLRDRLAQLAGWLDPTRGDIRWRVTRPDLTRREIVCRYAGGLDDMYDPAHPTLESHGTLDYLASDPYWQDLADTVATWTVPAAARGFFPVALPLRLSSSTVWVSETLDNSGYDRQDAWPVWTIVGPGVDPALRNLTTGKAIRIGRTLATGERLVIDTRPGVKSVTDGRGSVVPTVAGSTLWALVRGLNAIQVELSGATSGASSIGLAYRKKYLGP